MENQNRATLSRRTFFVVVALTGCAGAETATPRSMDGRLRARPASGGPRAARPTAPWLYVPRNVKEPAPLIVVLHGAGGRGVRALELLRADADRIGAIVIAPDSDKHTWDVIVDGFGADVERIDAHLAAVFGAYAIDPGRIAIGGFSDGASYALTLGVMNGDLFTHVLAFSPGFLAASSQAGAPRIYMSHGTRDEVLPIDRCSRRLAPALERAGYEVVYREFDGGHTVPVDIAREAVEWFAQAGS